MVNLCEYRQCGLIKHCADSPSHWIWKRYLLTIKTIDVSSSWEREVRAQSRLNTNYALQMFEANWTSGRILHYSFLLLVKIPYLLWLSERSKIIIHSTVWHSLETVWIIHAARSNVNRVVCYLKKQGENSALFWMTNRIYYLSSLSLTLYIRQQWTPSWPGLQIWCWSWLEKLT